MMIRFLLFIGLMFVAAKSTPILRDTLQRINEQYLTRVESNARLTRGRWTVYLTLRNNLDDVYEIRNDIKSQGIRILDFVAKLNCPSWDLYTVNTDHPDRNIVYSPCHPFWKESIRQRLESVTKTPFYHHHQPILSKNRSKRSLIDGIGRFSKWAFGTAMDEDVQTALNLIANARSKQNKIVHKVASLATILDHALEQIDDNKNDLHHSMFILRKLQRDFDLQAQAFTLFRTVESIDYYVSAILDLMSQLDHVEVIHHQNLQDVRSGHITERLLPPAILQGIRELAITMSYDTPRADWLRWYENLYFIYEDNDQLIYKLQIPLLEDTEYLYYEFSAYPHWINNSIVTLQLHETLLYDTISAIVAKPDHCVGHAPIVCDPVPLWTAASLRCEVGIITQHDDSLTACTYDVDDAPRHTIIEQTPHDTIIYLPRQEMTLACTGQPQQRLTYENGVYRATVPSQCVLSGHDWSVKGTAIRTLNKTINEIDTPQVLAPLPKYWLNATYFDPRDNDEERLNDAFDAIHEHRNLTSIDRNKLQNLMNDLNELQNENDTILVAPSVHDIYQIIVIAFIVIIVLIFVSCIIKYRRGVYFAILGKPWPYCTKLTKDPSVAAPKPSIELTSVTVDNSV